MGKSVNHLGDYRKNPHAEYAPRYYLENTHEPIVDRDTWEAAARIMAERSRNFCREKPTHTFSGLITCGCCGRKYGHKVNNGQFSWRSEFWACSAYLQNGTKACNNSRIKDAVLKEKFVSAYNEFIRERPQGDSLVALQEVLEDMRQQELDLAELMIKRLISKEAYNQERRKIQDQVEQIKEKISERRNKRVPESEHEQISAFDPDKALRFLSKVIVTRFTVTFEFYNGARISRVYDNGQAGNKPGWNKKKEDARWLQE